MPHPEVGDRAPDVPLLGGEGEAVPMSRLWRDRPVVAVFLRHYG